MKKQTPKELFELAQQLKDKGLRNKQIAALVGRAPTTMSTWNKYATYESYSQANREQFKKYSKQPLFSMNDLHTATAEQITESKMITLLTEISESLKRIEKQNELPTYTYPPVTLT